MTSQRIGRGAHALGRSVIVAPGQSTPAEWADVERVGVDVTTAALAARRPDDPAVLAIHRAWVRRTACVYEVDTGFDLRHGAAVAVGDHWDLGVDTEPPGERAAFHISANAIDLRSGHAVSPLFDAAHRAGARPDGPADVIDAQGRALWLDGGPLEWIEHDLDGIAVVPRLHLERGSLQPLGDLAPIPSGLAPDQAAAVTHRRGTARIIAPAGSGKTRVLTERVRRLVAGGLAPGAVTLVAYNTRAQAEMQARLADVRGLEVRTLHALARRIVVDARGGRSPEVIDERRVRRILGDLVPAGPRRANTDPLESWVDAVVWARDTLASPDAVLAAFPDIASATQGDPTVFARVIDRYRRALAAAGAVDFSEMVLGAITSLLTDPARRARVRAGVGTLAVDEFQDLTPALMLFVRLLAGPSQEVFAVGDDDQTIYGFSGADPRWLVDFTTWFPGAAEHALEVNYRCPADVVTAADRLLRRNTVRVVKTIRPAPGRDGTGLALRVADDPTAMNAELVALVRDRLASGADPASIAVLARTNAVLLAPQLFLADARIPVVVPPGLGPDLLERSGVAALLAWIDVAVSGADRFDAAALAIALSRPATSLPPRVTEAVHRMRDVSDLRRFADGSTSERIRTALDRFATDVERVVRLTDAGADTAALIGAVLDDIGLGRSADGLDGSQRATRRATHRDQLDSLRAVAALEPDPTRFRSFLQRSLTDVRRRGDDAGGLTLATVHTVKGQEWDHVHLVDASAPMFPHRLAESVEEERRVFHVAITRGRRSVTVHTDTERRPSPFVAELVDEPGATMPVTGRAPTPTPNGRPTRGPRRQADTPADDSPLRVALVAWRRQRAAGKPAYTVMNNAVLDEIVRRRPMTEADLGAVPGIGPHRLATLGSEILALVAAHPDG